ncbi:MAG: hypothetical protein K8E66_12385, partial [Phycisphaerales bacterium]|nr:hypothetical protein [Phycisphaerales bacterium]
HTDHELEPYRKLLTASVPIPAVMVAHLMHTEHDPRHPASLSNRVIDGLLRGQLRFGGVVVTDSIDMAAISDLYSAGRATVLALHAGADLVVNGFNLGSDREHPARAMSDAMHAAIDSGELSIARVRESIARLARWRGATKRAAHATPGSCG